MGAGSVQSINSHLPEVQRVPDGSGEVRLLAEHDRVVDVVVAAVAQRALDLHLVGAEGALVLGALGVELREEDLVAGRAELVLVVDHPAAAVEAGEDGFVRVDEGHTSGVEAARDWLAVDQEPVTVREGGPFLPMVVAPVIFAVL